MSAKLTEMWLIIVTSTEILKLIRNQWSPWGCGAVVERALAMQQVAGSIPAQVWRLLSRVRVGPYKRVPGSQRSNIHCKSCYFVGSRLVGSQPTVSLADSRKWSWANTATSTLQEQWYAQGRNGIVSPDNWATPWDYGPIGNLRQIPALHTPAGRGE